MEPDTGEIMVDPPTGELELKEGRRNTLPTTMTYEELVRRARENEPPTVEVAPEETSEVSHGTSTAALCDVGRNGTDRSTNLAGQPKLFFARKRFGSSVDRERQLMTLRPELQLPKIPHRPPLRF